MPPSALAVRERFGIGQAIDLSTQDYTARVTMPLWGKSRTGAELIILRANDGFVITRPTSPNQSPQRARNTADPT